MKMTVTPATGPLSASEVRRLIDQNPCLSLIKELRSLDDALDAMTCIPDECTPEMGVTEDDFQIPTSERGRLAYELASAGRASARQRDLSSAEFRRKMTSAGVLINHHANRHGHALPVNSVTVPNAAPRGFFVIVPAGMGQRA